MWTSRAAQIVIAVGLLAPASCGGGGGGGSPAPGITSFSTVGGWICAAGEDCQDVYDLYLAANTTLTISVSSVTGGSTLRLSLHGPGVPLNGTNLLNSSTNDRECQPQNTGETLAPVFLGAAGTYRLAVGRDWGFSSGASGTFQLDVSSDIDMGGGSGLQTVDDVNSQATGATCP